MDRRDKRNPNFTTEEMMKLTEEVENRKDMIFSKYNDSLTNAMKKRAWEVISTEVNALNPLGYRRTGVHMRKKWTCLLSETRKRISSMSKESLRDKITPLESRVLRIAGETMVPEVDWVSVTLKDEIEDVEEERSTSSPVNIQPADVHYNSSRHVSSAIPMESSADDHFECNGGYVYNSAENRRQEQLMLCEEERLQIEQKRIEMHQRLLNIERDRLEVEKERLEVERLRLEVERERHKLRREQYIQRH